MLYNIIHAVASLEGLVEALETLRRIFQRSVNYMPKNHGKYQLHLLKVEQATEGPQSRVYKKTTSPVPTRTKY